MSRGTRGRVFDICVPTKIGLLFKISCVGKPSYVRQFWYPYFHLQRMQNRFYLLPRSQSGMVELVKMTCLRKFEVGVHKQTPAKNTVLFVCARFWRTQGAAFARRCEYSPRKKCKGESKRHHSSFQRNVQGLSQSESVIGPSEWRCDWKPCPRPFSGSDNPAIFVSNSSSLPHTTLHVCEFTSGKYMTYYYK